MLCTIVILCLVVALFIPVRIFNKQIPLACAPFVCFNAIFIGISLALFGCAHATDQTARNLVSGACDACRRLAAPVPVAAPTADCSNPEHVQVEFYDHGALRAIAWAEGPEVC